MHESIVLFEKKAQVGVVTLNRPERLNAINYQLATEITRLLDRIAKDRGIRVVVLTGAGRAFCAGADIKEMADPKARRLPLGVGSFFDKIEALDKPVIAAINGPANGGGVELALACDFRLASETANFGLGEVKLGLIPSGGGTARLPRLIGIPKAKEILYFGNLIGAQEAYQLGLVNKVVPIDKLMEEAYVWAAELKERSPLALQMLKSCVNTGSRMDLYAAIDYEAKCSTILFESEDSREGLSAFVEKRKPMFRGR